MAGHFRVGTSGWLYRHWREVFYPPKLPQAQWFAFYAAEFDTVEINNTFYRLPEATVFDHWRTQAPPGFVYAVKASRYLTHIKRLADPAESLDRILSRARHLEDNLGPILYQLPPNWHENLPRLSEFLSLLPEDLNHVFEFRDPDWFKDEVRDALAQRHVSLCLVDRGGLRSTLWDTGRVVYVRFHGAASNQGRYSPDELRPWADRITQSLALGHDVYAYFNNDAWGWAVVNARELREMVR